MKDLIYIKNITLAVLWIIEWREQKLGRVVQRLEMIVVGYRMVVEGLERSAYTWKLE